MPKIIENLRENILANAIEMVEDGGIDNLSVRVLSKRCGVAPGTVYNYYASKEILVGTVLATRWENNLAAIDAAISEGEGVLDTFVLMVEQLAAFMEPVAPYWASLSSRAFRHSRDASDLKADEDDLARIAHVEQKTSLINEDLLVRVETVLEQAGTASSVVSAIAPTITRLLIICSHDRGLDIRDVVQACIALPR